MSHRTWLTVTALLLGSIHIVCCGLLGGVRPGSAGPDVASDSASPSFVCPPELNRVTTTQNPSFLLIGHRCSHHQRMYCMQNYFMLHDGQKLLYESDCCPSSDRVNCGDACRLARCNNFPEAQCIVMPCDGSVAACTPQFYIRKSNRDGQVISLVDVTHACDARQ